MGIYSKSFIPHPGQNCSRTLKLVTSNTPRTSFSNSPFFIVDLMAPTLLKYKAAAVNAEPGWLDLELSVKKTIHWINEAGKNGCKLIAFPELCKP